MLEQLGALNNDALPWVDARGNEHAFAVKRLDVHRSLLEPLGGDVDINEVLPVALAQQVGIGDVVDRFPARLLFLLEFLDLARGYLAEIVRKRLAGFELR